MALGLSRVPPEADLLGLEAIQSKLRMPALVGRFKPAACGLNPLNPYM